MNSPKRLYQEVGIALKDRIEAGEFIVGDKLPAEREIAEMMNVSRSVVREALIMLELQEIVNVRKGSGVYVTHLPSDTVSDEAHKHKQLDHSTSDVGPFELLQARQFLESRIAEFAATQVTKNDISRLKQALEMERSHLENDSQDYDGDEMFHIAIAEASQNSVLADMVKDLWVRRNNSSMWQQLHVHISNQDYRKKWLHDHEKILAALQRKDPAAARDAMWQHLENVKQTLLGFSDVDHPEFDGFLFNENPIIN
ncbi:FCD domain-containing protein [Alginatibacterium sediminis]|uniref:FCD domain-containing protein n=1 Tax=Alginatibacterium sediminis TaxID=2164068 RepID=A0A420EHB8_9ALTE|nr:FCD domain-containing protein [Alginatibacterium sediminis]RKF20060.1 FCD domain-containing protein [Alginatibacterium sediminis]